jgi:hypothetical protein
MKAHGRLGEILMAALDYYKLFANPTLTGHFKLY